LTSIHTPVVLWCSVGLWIASHSRLCINGPSEPGRLRHICVCQWVKQTFIKGGKSITFPSSSVSHCTEAVHWQMYIHIHLCCVS